MTHNEVTPIWRSVRAQRTHSPDIINESLEIFIQPSTLRKFENRKENVFFLTQIENVPPVFRLFSMIMTGHFKLPSPNVNGV